MQKIMFVDDLDGTEGAETVRFAFKNNAYEIDLSLKNVDKLEKLLQPYIDASRSPGSSSSPRQRRARGTAPARTSTGIDYTSPAHAGSLHRGRVTEAEAAYVRDNLEEVNKRLQANGEPEIDPKDARAKARYGF